MGWGGVVLGWVALWGVIGGDLVTWFFMFFMWWCGASEGFCLPSNWVCIPWFLMHLALIFLAFCLKKNKKMC